MAQQQRKQWTDDDRRFLIENWVGSPSVFLLALQLGRSYGVVTVRASEMDLPKRNLLKYQKHQPWTAEAVAAFEAAIGKHTRMDGKIDIVALAEDVDRPIDAIARRLGLINESFEVVSERVYCDFRSLNKVNNPKEYFDEHGDIWTELDIAMGKVNIEDLEELEPEPKDAKERQCIMCRTPFYSTGPGHRLCDSCKEHRSGLEDHGLALDEIPYFPL